MSLISVIHFVAHVIVLTDLVDGFFSNRYNILTCGTCHRLIDFDWLFDWSLLLKSSNIYILSFMLRLIDLIGFSFNRDKNRIRYCTYDRLLYHDKFVFIEGFSAYDYENLHESWISPDNPACQSHKISVRTCHWYHTIPNLLVPWSFVFSGRIWPLVIIEDWLMILSHFCLRTEPSIEKHIVLRSLHFHSRYFYRCLTFFIFIWLASSFRLRVSRYIFLFDMLRAR